LLIKQNILSQFSFHLKQFHFFFLPDQTDSIPVIFLVQIVKVKSRRININR